MLNFFLKKDWFLAVLGQLSFVLSFSLSLLFVLLFQHSIPTGHMGTFTVPLDLLSTPPPVPSQRKRNTSSISVAYTFTRARSNSQWPAPQRNINSSSPAPLPEAITCGELHLSTPSQFLSFWWLSVCAIFLHTITKVASLPFSQQEHRSWTYIRSLATAQITDSVCGLCCSRGLCWFQWSVLSSETMLRSFST